jgi:hypothetical protein
VTTIFCRSAARPGRRSRSGARARRRNRGPRSRRDRRGGLQVSSPAPRLAADSPRRARPSGPACPGTRPDGAARPRGARTATRRRRRLRVELAQRRQVVEDPERPAVRARDEVATPHDEVADRAVGQIELQRLPALAVVERHEHARLGAGVEQPAPLGVLAHDVDETAARNPRAIGGPVLPASRSGRRTASGRRAGGARRRVAGVGVEVRRLERRDARPGGESGRRDVRQWRRRRA